MYCDIDVAASVRLVVFCHSFFRLGIEVANVLYALGLWRSLFCRSAHVQRFNVVVIGQHLEHPYVMVELLLHTIVIGPTVRRVMLLLDALPVFVVIVARLHHESRVGLASCIVEHQHIVPGVNQRLRVAGVAVAIPVLDDEIGAFHLFWVSVAVFLLGFVEVVVPVGKFVDFRLFVYYVVDNDAHVFRRLPVLAVLFDFLLGVGIGGAYLFDASLFCVLCLCRSEAEQADDGDDCCFHTGFLLLDGAKIVKK